MFNKKVITSLLLAAVLVGCGKARDGPNRSSSRGAKGENTCYCDAKCPEYRDCCNPCCPLVPELAPACNGGVVFAEMGVVGGCTYGHGCVRIETNKESYASDERMVITLHNEMHQSVYVDGCQPFGVIPVDVTPEDDDTASCNKVADEIKKGRSKKYELTAGPEGNYQLRADLGVNCSSDVPMTTDNCAAVQTATSQQYSIVERSCPPISCKNECAYEFKTDENGCNTCECADAFACTANTDCKLVKKDCCGCQMGGTSIAINKDFERFFNVSDDCEDVRCRTVASCTGSATCLNNHCEMVELP